VPDSFCLKNNIGWCEREVELLHTDNMLSYYCSLGLAETSSISLFLRMRPGTSKTVLKSRFIDTKAGCKAIYGLFGVVSVGLNCQMKFLISTEGCIRVLGSHINEELAKSTRNTSTAKPASLPGAYIIFGCLRGTFRWATANHSMLISPK
jgi:hypothetical protein